MKIALHSVSYSGTWGGQKSLTLEEFIGKAANLGYEGVEFAGKRPHASPLDFDAERRKRIKTLLKEKNLTLCCMASYHDFAPFFEHSDMAYFEKELVYMKNVIELAYDLGCSVVRTYTGYFKEGIPYRKQWESCVTGIKESARIASDYGITIGVQNHSCIASSPDSLLDFIAEVNEENIGAVLDAPYIANHNMPLKETVLKYRDLICHTHLTDFIRREKYRYLPETVTFENNGTEMLAVPVGQGSTDYREFITALKEAGYGGFLSYEMCSPLVGGGYEENLDRCARETLSFINSL
jgi:sugar phosphate isomerase/epimerase